MIIFDSLKIKQLTLQNRVVMAPMCMYQASNDGVIQPFHLHHYMTRAYGGVGLIIQEATAVEPRGRISPNDLGIWSDEHVIGLKSLVDAVHETNSKIAIQLAHAGRKCTVKTEKIIAPSTIAFNSDYATPQEMSIVDIKEVITAFGKAAKRANAAGYDVVEIHGAHGYLINQFLSPLTNKRNDAYGGSIANRVRFLEEIIEEVRKEWNKPLFVRLSAEEYHEDGHHIADTCAWLQSHPLNVDVIDVSSGGVVPVMLKAYPKYQIPYAKRIKELGYMTISGGSITSTEDIESILINHDSDLVYLGRELLRNPNFMQYAAKAAKRNDLLFSSYQRSFD